MPPTHELIVCTVSTPTNPSRRQATWPDVTGKCLASRPQMVLHPLEVKNSSRPWLGEDPLNRRRSPMLGEEFTIVHAVALVTVDVPL